MLHDSISRISPSSFTVIPHSLVAFLRYAFQNWQCKDEMVFLFEIADIYIFLFSFEWKNNNFILLIMFSAITKSANSWCGSSCLQWRCMTTLIVEARASDVPLLLTRDCRFAAVCIAILPGLHVSLNRLATFSYCVQKVFRGPLKGNPRHPDVGIPPHTWST